MDLGNDIDMTCVQRHDYNTRRGMPSTDYPCPESRSFSLLIRPNCDHFDLQGSLQLNADVSAQFPQETDQYFRIQSSIKLTAHDICGVNSFIIDSIISYISIPINHSFLLGVGIKILLGYEYIVSISLRFPDAWDGVALINDDTFSPSLLLRPHHTRPSWQLSSHLLPFQHNKFERSLSHCYRKQIAAVKVNPTGRLPVGQRLTKTTTPRPSKASRRGPKPVAWKRAVSNRPNRPRIPPPTALRNPAGQVSSPNHGFPASRKWHLAILREHWWEVFSLLNKLIPIRIFDSGWWQKWEGYYGKLMVEACFHLRQSAKIWGITN